MSPSKRLATAESVPNVNHTPMPWRAASGGTPETWSLCSCVTKMAASDEGSMELAYRAGAAIPGFSIRQMLMSLVQTEDFRFRAPSPGEM